MLAQWLFEISGINLFDHRLFRVGAAALLSALLVFVLMPHFIRWLQSINATSDFNADAAPPPICGGLLIVFAVLMSTLCFTTINGYSGSIILIMMSYTMVGGLDDYMKIRTKRLVAEGKIKKADYQDKADGLSASLRLGLYFLFSLGVALVAYRFIPGINKHLAIPFIKPDLWYPLLPTWAFILLMSFVTTATANGANFTDGLDTLVTVPLITTSMFAGFVAYIAGNAIFSKYFLIPHLPGIDELLPICGAITGALIAYLWYNCPPAEIYMGDGGSIGLGGAIGMMFVMIKAELFLPIVGVIFCAEAISVFLQISFFKLTRKFSKDKKGRRIFRRAPLHDHFKLVLKERYPNTAQVNSKVIWRFHLVSVLALIIGSLIFFKIR